MRTEVYVELSVEERIRQKAEEIGPVEFIRKVGKNEYDLLALMATAANSSEEARAELADWDRVLQFKAPGAKSCYIKTAGGKMSAHLGEHESPAVTFETNSAEDMMAMLSGASDGTSMYMSGKLRIDGQLSDAIKFGNVGGLLAKLLTNEKIMAIWGLAPKDVAKKLGIA